MVAAGRGKGACRTRSGSAGAALVRGEADLLVPLSPLSARSWHIPARRVRRKEPALALHELVLTAQDSIDRHEIAVLVLVLGLIFFTVVTAIMLLRTHARASRLESSSRDQISTLRSELDRANALLFSEPQC